MAGLSSAEHIGQVRADDRQARETAFKEGRLSVLFGSPTMELGVDIKDLSVVHLRNLPPTPANYAQRSGRAGRGGKPALVVAFASYGNAHDRHFFREKPRMIAGAVAPLAIELANEDLFEAHLHSLWLSILGMGLGQPVAEILDLAQPALPLVAEKAALLEASTARFEGVLGAFGELAASAAPDLERAAWFSEAWLADRARNAARAFDHAFDRWRELYRAAIKQRDTARRMIDSPRLPRKDRERAEQQEREAKRELALLRNEAGSTETDFCPYRISPAKDSSRATTFPACRCGRSSRGATRHTRSTGRASSAWPSSDPATSSITRAASIASSRAFCRLPASSRVSFVPGCAAGAAAFTPATRRRWIFASTAGSGWTTAARNSCRGSSISRLCAPGAGPGFHARKRSASARATKSRPTSACRPAHGRCGSGSLDPMAMRRPRGPARSAS